MKAAELFDVGGRTALVTGAASGLGLGIAEVLADNGARVVMLDVDSRALEEAAAGLRARGAAVRAVVADVGDSGAVRAAVDRVVVDHGRLDIAFANAGMSAGPGFTTPAGEMEAVDEARWARVLDVNLTGVFVTMQAAARHMKRQRWGRIVVTASVAGLRAEPLVGYAYVATKAAVANLVRQAARELAPHNVLVNAIAPGPFLTNIADGRLRDPDVVRSFSETVPLGRIAEVNEIKGLALLLASPASSFITGTVIPIDGGVTAG